MLFTIHRSFAGGESNVKTNYVLIDYENVQPTDLRILNQEYFKIILFVGASQTKIALDIAVVLQDMGERAKYIRISGNGPNALDFHIAFYIGQLTMQIPDAYYHIISNDTGFDPLIQHLRERKIYVQRSKSIQEMPVTRALLATTLNDKVSLVKDDLYRRGESRPKTVAALVGTIQALFQKQLIEEELSLIIRALHNQSLITIAENKVTYRFPAN